MRRPKSPAAARPPLPPGEGRGEGAPCGFSLVELLVVITIMLALMGLAGAAVSNARNSQKRQETQGLIAKLDAVIQQQFASYAGRDVVAATPAARAVELRRQVTGDLPDRWVDVKFMADNAAQFTSPQQRVYIAVWNSFPASKRLCPGDTGYPTTAADLNNPATLTAHGQNFVSFAHSGAECLFMIVMRGGIANCLDCSDLTTGRIGDKDGDGAFEFWDAWNNPIGYILWPGALELPADSGQKFFSTSAPFAPGASGRTMRPLLYSAGPDGFEEFDNTPSKPTPQYPAAGWYGFRCNPLPAGLGQFRSSNLGSGSACGDPTQQPANVLAAPLTGASDNITNFDAEAKQ
jgi:prepilin-type N-terminal cleavage/methylation domain-containing protein